MKRLLLAIPIMMASCTTIVLPTQPTRFIVDKVRLSEDGKIAYYLVYPTDCQHLNCNETWFADSVGLYKKGDPVYFGKR